MIPIGAAGSRGRRSACRACPADRAVRSVRGVRSTLTLHAAGGTCVAVHRRLTGSTHPPTSSTSPPRRQGTTTRSRRINPTRRITANTASARTRCSTEDDRFQTHPEERIELRAPGGRPSRPTITTRTTPLWSRTRTRPTTTLPARAAAAALSPRSRSSAAPCSGPPVPTPTAATRFLPARKRRRR